MSRFHHINQQNLKPTERSNIISSENTLKFDMECHQRQCIQNLHMGQYRVCIGTLIHFSACNNKDIFPSIQSSGTCTEPLERRQPSPKQGILCYPIHSCKLGGHYEPLACIQNKWFDHWSTACKNVTK